MMYDNYFPRGVAVGEAFCNRENERKRLLKNIKSGQHTLLLSPRRYGKTSLVRYVLNESGLVFGEADLFVAIDAKRIEQQVLSGIKMVFRMAGTSVDQTLRVVREFFKSRDSKWVIGTQGLNLALVPSQDSDPATNIMDALLALETLLAQRKKRAVIFLDEVQELGEVAEGRGIEGAIRHVAQETKYLAFVFSGSNRHLLSRMFFDKTRPLYKLCDRIVLERIAEIDYEKHLNKMAKKRWKKTLTAAALSTLFTLTECHPYYMNNLCLRLWDSSLQKIPTPEIIQTIWDAFVIEERAEIMRELLVLSSGQRKLLIELAGGWQSGFTRKDMLKKLDISSASVTEALRTLEHKDYIQLGKEGYTIIDPLIKATLNLHFGEKQER
jgi:hypothetical protein